MTLAPSGALGSAEAPRRVRLALQRAVMPPSWSAARASSASENGSVLSPTICPVSCPLPAIKSASPSRSIANALANGRRTVADLDRRRRGGGNLRADRRPDFRSEGCRRSQSRRQLKRAAIAPMIGRFPGSRSPPHRTPGRDARARTDAARRSPFRARQACAHSRRRALAPRMSPMRSSRPGAPWSVCSASNTASAWLPVAMQSPAATSALEI